MMHMHSVVFCIVQLHVTEDLLSKAQHRPMRGAQTSSAASTINWLPTTSVCESWLMQNKQVKLAETEHYLPPMRASAAIEGAQTGVQWGLQTQGTYDPGRSCAGCSGAKGRHQSATLGHPRGETLGQQPCLQCPTCTKQHALNQLTCKAWKLVILGLADTGNSIAVTVQGVGAQ